MRWGLTSGPSVLPKKSVPVLLTGWGWVRLNLVCAGSVIFSEVNNPPTSWEHRNCESRTRLSSKPGTPGRGALAIGSSIGSRVFCCPYAFAGFQPPMNPYLPARSMPKSELFKTDNVEPYPLTLELPNRIGVDLP